MSSNQRLVKILEICSSNSIGKRKIYCEGFLTHLSRNGFLTQKQMDTTRSIVAQVSYELSAVESFEKQLGSFLKSSETSFLKLAN